MLSICIPVYNSDVSELVTSLFDQIEGIDYPIEICVIDDASTNSECDLSRINHPKIIVHKNAENVGRAKVRNQFIHIINNSYLLFLDGDSRIIRPDFLKSYCDLLKSSKVEVICGASVYQLQKPKRTHYLRWKYSTIRESKSIEERRQNLDLGFKTNNFIIHRDIFNRIQFNETIIGYGHEDSLYGFELKKSNIQIQHIDNPVLNYQLDDNKTFLKKTKEGVRNLKHVLQIVNYDKLFLNSSKLGRVYVLINRLNIRWFVYFLISTLHPLNTFFLTRGIFVLLMFDLYKLYFILKRENL
jgi:glycosyltransferase involved in cell wall biosynthesis